MEAAALPEFIWGLKEHKRGDRLEGHERSPTGCLLGHRIWQEGGKGTT